MPKKANRDAVYTRAIRFRIFPNDDQIAYFQKVSDHLFEIWNRGVAENGAWYQEHIAPLVEEFQQMNSPEAKAGVKEKINARWKKRKEEKEDTGPHTPVNFNYRLSEWRKQFPEYTRFPTDWQRETLRSLAGAIASWQALRAKGDVDARRPRERNAGYFNEIICYGSGWKVENNTLCLSATVFGETVMHFNLPGVPYIQELLKKSEKLVRCIVNRYPADLVKPGEWYVSLVADFPRPTILPKHDSDLVFVALGANACGIVSAKGEEEIVFLRPDKLAVPDILELKARLKGEGKGSRRWKKLYGAKRDVEQKMASQQKQNHNELVAHFLKPHGAHFVVTDLVVRSKEGKLADGENPKRGGVLGANWAAQNTGSIAAFTAQLGVKTEEWGGSVTKFNPGSPGRKLGKIEMAQFLRKQYLASLKE